MTLPRVKIEYLNGQLGTVGESPDGLFALVCGAVAVGGTFALEQAYRVYRLEGLTALGVTSENNPRLWKHVREFYDEAGDGVELVVYGVAKTSTFTQLCDKTSGSIRSLIAGQNGRLRGVFVAGDGLGSGAVTEGLAPDVYTALPLAQQLAEWATAELYAPLFMVLEGRGYTTGSSMRDLSTLANNRVGVLVGDTVANSEGACVGTMAGRLATLPVHRNLGRVKSGALFPTEMYIGSEKVDELYDKISELYELGYITPRMYVGRSGYYFADDRLACASDDDYAHITNRRVIDKAYRIVYDTLLDMLLDEIELNEDGTMQAPVIKSWQQTVEDALNSGMTAEGELSASDGGEGCSCYIAPEQNVLATSKVEVTVKVRPFGYPRMVDVSLGFLVTQN